MTQQIVPFNKWRERNFDFVERELIFECPQCQGYGFDGLEPNPEDICIVCHGDGEIDQSYSYYLRCIDRDEKNLILWTLGGVS